MCPYQAQFTIFQVLTCLLFLWVRCVCVLRWYVCVRCCVVVVCRTHSQDHGIHLHMDVHVGVTLFAHFLMKKTQSRTLIFHDVCFSKPLTFHNGFMFFLLLEAVSSTF